MSRSISFVRRIFKLIIMNCGWLLGNYENFNFEWTYSMKNLSDSGHIDFIKIERNACYVLCKMNLREWATSIKIDCKNGLEDGWVGIWITWNVCVSIYGAQLRSPSGKFQMEKLMFHFFFSFNASNFYKVNLQLLLHMSKSFSEVDVKVKPIMKSR